MQDNKHLYFILVAVLLAGNLFFGFQYFSQLSAMRSSEAKAELNGKVRDFALMFIRDVLQAEGEVDFETRLKLENTVRDLGDAEIKAEWKNFTDSKTEVGAQESVKKLLEILVTKIQK